MKIIASFLIPIALVLFMFGFLSSKGALRNAYLSSDGVPVTATVYDTYDPGEESSLRYLIQWEYDGETYDGYVTSSIASVMGSLIAKDYTQRIRKGSEILIAVDPEDPDRFLDLNKYHSNRQMTNTCYIGAVAVFGLSILLMTGSNGAKRMNLSIPLREDPYSLLPIELEESPCKTAFPALPPSTTCPALAAAHWR